MKKTVYIHIGVHKTGTSTIQNLLSNNRDVLKEQGIIYPGNKSAHHDMAKEFRTLPLEQILKKNSRSQAYLREIIESPAEKSILSSEVFETLIFNAGKLREFLPHDLEIKIIVYLRRQDDLLESKYNQRVREPQIRLEKSFTDYFSSIGLYNPKLDYYNKLTPWADSFGKENLIIRIYEKDKLRGNLFNDFISVIGLENADSIKVPDLAVNTSWSWDIIEFMRICNNSFRKDDGMHDFLLRSLAKARVVEKEKKRLLSPQQRREIIAHYADSNAKVAREYLGREDGRLFYAPLPNLDEPWEPNKGLTVEKVVPIFMQMLHNLDKEMNKRSHTKNILSKKSHFFNKITNNRFIQSKNVYSYFQKRNRR